jgi:hypothetical protein
VVVQLFTNGSLSGGVAVSIAAELPVNFQVFTFHHQDMYCVRGKEIGYKVPFPVCGGTPFVRQNGKYPLALAWRTLAIGFL